MLKDKNIPTINPSTTAMVAFVYSSRHKEEEDASEMLDEYNKNLINKDESYE